MNIEIAKITRTNEIIEFFDLHLSRDNDAIYSPEFFCKDGVRAAVRNGRVLIACNGEHIVAALRFYKRKTQDILSLYQFAIDEPYRGKGLIQKMLSSLQSGNVEVCCPSSSVFNAYYVKTGWTILTRDEKLIRWVLTPDKKEMSEYK
ncbi:GNAT family N-acetyltransferase [Paenibacillus sp. KN14-4R]|uniref:GNAT family N-acetyltransferase n=1 Tax=Paenibacillus sp. KN14-4R TaxID=3445773 RepID=UPI003FA066E8